MKRLVILALFVDCSNFLLRAPEVKSYVVKFLEKV